MKKEEIKEWYRKFMEKNPRLRKIIGVGCIVIGLLALITPLTPGSWLIFVGLEVLGIRFLFLDKIKKSLRKREKEKTKYEGE